VSPHLVERIRSAAVGLGYTPNEAARNLRLLRTMTLGAVFDRFEEPMFMDLLEGLSSACQKHGYSLAITTARGDQQVYEAQLQRLFERRVDGLFVVGPPDDLGDSVAPFLDAGIPALALFWRGRGSDRLPLVRVHHEEAIRAAMTRLAAEGHRSVLYFTRPIRPRNIRDLVLRQAGTELNMKVATESISFDRPDGTHRQLIEEHLRRADAPTALFADANSLPPVAQALRELGLQVPGDISVVTFDESQWHKRLGLPWSTICFDGQEVGRTAGRLMAESLAGNPPPDITSAAEYQWIERGSVGPAHEHNNRQQ
jgi:LacI family transcriptional regulator